MSLTANYAAFNTSRVILQPLLVDLLDVRNLIIDESRTTERWAGLTYDEWIAWIINRLNIRHINKMNNPHQTRPSDLSMNTRAQSGALRNSLLQAGLLPFSRIGSPDSLPLNITNYHGSSGSFHYGRCSGAICMEGDGTVSLLRNGTDGITTGVYYAHALHAGPFGTAEDMTFTTVRYNPSYFYPDWKALGIVASGDGVVIGAIGSPDGLERKYFVSITGGTFGGDHKGFFIDPNEAVDAIFMERSVGIAFAKDTLYVFTETLRQVPTDPVNVSVMGVANVSSILGTTVPLSNFIGWYGKDFFNKPYPPQDQIKIAGKLYTESDTDTGALYDVEEDFPDKENLNHYGIKFYPFVTTEGNLVVRYAMRASVDNIVLDGIDGYLPGVTEPVRWIAARYESALLSTLTIDTVTKEAKVIISSYNGKVNGRVIPYDPYYGILPSGEDGTFGSSSVYLSHACWENASHTQLFPHRNEQIYLLNNLNNSGTYCAWIHNPDSFPDTNTLSGNLHFARVVKDVYAGSHQGVVAANLRGFRQVNQWIGMYLGSGWNPAKQKNQDDWILAAYKPDYGPISSGFLNPEGTIMAREQLPNQQFVSATTLGEAGKYQYCRSMTESITGDANAWRFSTATPYSTDSPGFNDVTVKTISGVNVNTTGASGFAINESGFYPLSLSTAFVTWARALLHSYNHMPEQYTSPNGNYILEVFAWQFQYNCPLILTYTYYIFGVKYIVVGRLFNVEWFRPNGRPDRTGELRLLPNTIFSPMRSWCEVVDSLTFANQTGFRTVSDHAGVTVASVNRSEDDQSYCIGIVMSNAIYGVDAPRATRIRFIYRLWEGTVVDFVHDTVDILNNPETFFGNFMGFGVSPVDQIKTDGHTRVCADHRAGVTNDYPLLRSQWNQWKSINAPALANIYQKNPKGFILHFLLPEPVIINGESHWMERTSIDLSTITPSPQNKTFFVYVGIFQGDQARYLLSLTRLSESHVAMWIGTVETDNVGISRINIDKVSRIEEYRLSSEPIGSAIPFAPGYPSDPSELRKAWFTVPTIVTGTFSVSRTIKPNFYDDVVLTASLTGASGGIMLRSPLSAVGGDNSFKVIPMDGIVEVRSFVATHSGFGLPNTAYPVLLDAVQANQQLGLPYVLNRYYLIANDFYYSGNNSGNGTFTMECQTGTPYVEGSPDGTLLWKGNVETIFDGSGSTPYPRSRVVSTEYTTDRPLQSKPNVVSGQTRGGDMWVDGVTSVTVRHMGDKKVDRYDVSTTPRYNNPVAGNRRYLNGILNAAYVGMGVSAVETIEVWGSSVSLSALYQPAITNTTGTLKWNTDKTERLVLRFAKNGQYQFCRKQGTSNNLTADIQILSTYNWIKAGPAGIQGTLNPDPANYEFRFTLLEKTLAWGSSGFDVSALGTAFALNTWMSFTSNDNYIGFGIGGLFSGVNECMSKIRVEVREKSTTDGFGSGSAELVFNTGTLPPSAMNYTGVMALQNYEYLGEPNNGDGRLYIKLLPNGTISSGWKSNGDDVSGPFPFVYTSIPTKNMVVLGGSEVTPLSNYRGFFEFKITPMQYIVASKILRMGSGSPEITNAILRGEWFRLNDTLEFTYPFLPIPDARNFKFAIMCRRVTARGTIANAIVHVGNP